MAILPLLATDKIKSSVKDAYDGPLMRGAISYLDFYLLLSGTERGYRAQVLSSPAGEASSDFVAPFSDLELDNFVLRIGRPRRSTRRTGSPEMEAIKTLGKGLYEAVFTGDVKACWSASLAEAEAQNAGLRLRLRIAEAPELNDVPWEYLYNASLNRFLSLSEYTPLIRYLDLPERIRPLPVDGRLEILVMISSPTDYPGLDVENEWSRLNEALAGPITSGLVRLRRLPEPRLAVLQRELRRGEYHILHFIGHAGFDREAQGGRLVLCDDAGKGRPVAAENLGFILHDHRSLRLVVLNACEGSRASRADPFAGVAQTLLQQGVPAVIAMQFEITDQAAVTFAEEFYAAVADGHPVDAALANARKAIFGVGNDTEWGTPVLYLRAPDGRLFVVNRDAVAARKSAMTPRRAKEEQERVAAAQRAKEEQERVAAAYQSDKTFIARPGDAAQRLKEEERAAAAQRAKEEQERAAAAQRAKEEQERAAAAQRAKEEQERAAAAQRAKEERERAAAAQRLREKRQRAAAARQRWRLEWERKKNSAVDKVKKIDIVIPAIGIIGLLLILACFDYAFIEPKARMGSLNLGVTPPGAILTLDGKQIGPVKDYPQELSAGSHVIEISAEGYEPAKQTIAIFAGETLSFPLQLARIQPPPTNGILMLELAPPETVLTLDGKLIGPANGFNQELSAGTHMLEVSADDYGETKQTVTIVAGETLPVSLRLAPLPPPPTGPAPQPTLPSERAADSHAEAARAQAETLPRASAPNKATALRPPRSSAQILNAAELRRLLLLHGQSPARRAPPQYRSR